MAIYICTKCGHGVSTSENHICLFKKPINDVPEHIKNYGRNIVEYNLKDNKTRAWF